MFRRMLFVIGIVVLALFASASHGGRETFAGASEASLARGGSAPGAGGLALLSHAP